MGSAVLLVVTIGGSGSVEAVSRYGIFIIIHGKDPSSSRIGKDLQLVRLLPVLYVRMEGL